MLLSKKWYNLPRRQSAPPSPCKQLCFCAPYSINSLLQPFIHFLIHSDLQLFSPTNKWSFRNTGEIYPFDFLQCPYNKGKKRTTSERSKRGELALYLYYPQELRDLLNKYIWSTCSLSDSILRTGHTKLDKLRSWVVSELTHWWILSAGTVLHAFCVPGSMLGSGRIAVNETEKVSVFKSIVFSLHFSKRTLTIHHLYVFGSTCLSLWNVNHRPRVRCLLSLLHFSKETTDAWFALRMKEWRETKLDTWRSVILLWLSNQKVNGHFLVWGDNGSKNY